MENKIKLPDNLVEQLIELPESGMGYQMVTLTLKNNIKLKNRKIVNSEFLIIYPTEKYTTFDFTDVELEKKSSAQD